MTIVSNPAQCAYCDRLITHCTCYNLTRKQVKTTGPEPDPNEDLVNHPPHYKTGGIETIDFIDAKKLGYYEGNVVKYVTRAKHKGNELQDLKKAQWYLNRRIAQLENNG